MIEEEYKILMNGFKLNNPIKEAKIQVKDAKGVIHDLKYGSFEYNYFINYGKLI